MMYAILAVLILIFIAFAVLLWKASKNWRWYHITASVFIMILAIALLFPTAGVLKSRKEWHKVNERMAKQAEQVKRDNFVLRYGDPTDPNAGESVTDLSLKLSKLGREAGRRWRDFIVQNANAQSVVLSAPAPVAAVAAPTADGEAPAAPVISLPPENLVVYGFGEAVMSGKALPTFYMGEFRVTASAGNQITLQPTGQLEPAQLQRLSSMKSWSVYEMLPLDGHEPFIAEGSKMTDDNILGRVDDALVNQLLQNKIRPETLQQYLRDGSRANQDDPPLSRWIKLEFVKNHTVDVDSKTKGALTDAFFDSGGRSLDARLQRGGDVSFRKGDSIVVKEETTKPLDQDSPPLFQVEGDDAVAKVIGTFFKRPLNDYRFVLRKLRLRLIEAAIRKTELEYEREVLQDALDATTVMLTSNQKDKLALEQDLGQLQKELKAITDYESSLATDLKEARKTLLQLYQSNIKLEQELKRLISAS